MTARVDLRRLLDDVAMRAAKIEIAVDSRLEQSVAATVHTDRHGDSAAVFVRFAPDSASAALELALTDAAVWSNAQRGARKPIALDTLEPIWALKAMVRRLALRIEKTSGVDADVLAATELLCSLGDA